MRRPDLAPDCGRCAAVCCVALPFDACEDFAVAKGADTACPHLAADCRCRIHDALEARGFRGCAIFDCYGAGQRATRFDVADPALRNEAFRALRVLHELLFLLTEARKLPAAAAVRPALADEIERLDALAASTPRALAALDVRPRVTDTHALLRRIGRLHRAPRRGALVVIE